MSNIYYIDVARLEFPWFGAIIEQKNDYKMEEQSWFFTQIYNIGPYIKWIKDELIEDVV